MEEEEVPRDAKLVQSIVESMGVQHHEPRVVNQLLDFCYRYVVDVLTDAQLYSEHAGKSAIDCDDVKLAVQTKVNTSFSHPPPRELLLGADDMSRDVVVFLWVHPLRTMKLMVLAFMSGPHKTLLELARARNSLPLPKAVGGPGIALPPDQDTLLTPNWQLLIPTRLLQKQEEEMDVDEEDESKIDQRKRDSQPSNLQKNDQDGVQRVSFALPSKRPKTS